MAVERPGGRGVAAGGPVTVEAQVGATQQAAVTAALQEFIARREQRGVLELVGKLDWDPGYDYKRERARD